MSMENRKPTGFISKLGSGANLSAIGKFAVVGFCFVFFMAMLAGMASADLPAYNDTALFKSVWLPMGSSACPGLSNFGGTCWNWQYIAVLAVGTTLIINIVIYMLGYALSLENVKRFAKTEFFQVTASAFLIAGVVGVLDAALNYTTTQVIGAGSLALCNGQQINVGSTGPLYFVQCKIAENIDQLTRCYTTTFQANQGLERLASTCFSLIGIPVYCGDWSWHSMVEQNHLVGYKIIPLLTNLYGQEALIDYIGNNMLAVFLPLGIILRAFPIFRGVGGLFIAIAIGFYFVFPVLYLINDPTFVKIVIPLNNNYVDPTAQCYNGFKGSATIVNTPPYPSAGGSSFFGIACTNAEDLIVQVTVNLLFYPFVALAITLIFIRTVAPILGGESGELMRMVSRLI